MPTKKFDPQQDLVGLKGKVIIVTGGNRGTGLATVKHLAQAGAKVYMAARNEAKALEAIEKLKQEGLEPGNGQVEWLKLDLSDPREAKKAAQIFMEKEKRLDVLGSYLSPFVFTRTLLPVLTSTAEEADSDVRIVNLASIAHKFTPSGANFTTIEDLNVEYRRKILPGFMRYAHSKLLDILWTRALQKHFDTASPPIPITAIAIHPGGVDTFSHNWPLPWLWKPIVGLAINDTEHGSYTSVFAAASKVVRDEKEKYRGAYLESNPVGEIREPSAIARDDKLADDLWRLTESILETLHV
ncbi:NAD(P)-binding protein [Gymnopus androsaceus JB14]|uniref:NAD(P)-binding protein n=1 Tax=Gymnopus androsaceus JB14 TaxID=1447944 RepID=A0A6A4HIX5_9AGAR|nr:NAD(P)-binding protein [Gymnopus androsaceus JB14]